MFNRKNHAPKTLDDLVIPNPKTRKRLEDYANGDRIGHVLMHGPKGTGKTSAADIISKQHEGMNDNSPALMEDFRSYEGATMTEKDILNLPQEWHLRKIFGMKPATVVINELDKMSAPMLEKLKATMDQCDGAGQLVATTNNINKLPPALQDRLDCIEMPALSAEDFANRANEILQAEGVKITDAELRSVLASTTGSWRDALGAIEDVVLKKKP